MHSILSPSHFFFLIRWLALTRPPSLSPWSSFRWFTPHLTAPYLERHVGHYPCLQLLPQNVFHMGVCLWEQPWENIILLTSKNNPFSHFFSITIEANFSLLSPKSLTRPPILYLSCSLMIYCPPRLRASLSIRLQLDQFQNLFWFFSERLQWSRVWLSIPGEAEASSWPTWMTQRNLLSERRAGGVAQWVRCCHQTRPPGGSTTGAHRVEEEFQWL